MYVHSMWSGVTAKMIEEQPEATRTSASEDTHLGISYHLPFSYAAFITSSLLLPLPLLFFFPVSMCFVHHSSSSSVSICYHPISLSGQQFSPVLTSMIKSFLRQASKGCFPQNSIPSVLQRKEANISSFVQRSTHAGRRWNAYYLEDTSLESICWRVIRHAFGR